ncbi:lipase [Salinimicrobium marinum]|uniref:Lipase n=1 Tax=Salinimicrobium marinum TaxID=680283 RepID=A0A918VVG5_9FLAO|nr:alpha/beta hydrolase [Salinimicrobium marinum]GHA27981.1 lipase [Salinimicrobium marinum]
MKSKISLLLFFILIFTSCSKNDIPTTENFETKVSEKVLNDLKYGPDAAHTLDIYLPANRSPSTTRILVFIHGGGWITGDKSDMKDYIPLLQKNLPGYAIANLNYRLAKPPTRAAFPNQFLDLKLALEYLNTEAKNFDIKAEFAFIGASAGAHLALQFDSVYDLEDKVKLVCSIVGPTDFTDPFYTGNPEFDTALEQLVDESAYTGITDLARAISPAHLVTKNNSPTILFYGKDDPLVPISNGRFLKEQLDASGVINNFTLYDGGHGDWENAENFDMQLQLKTFIEEHF